MMTAQKHPLTITFVAAIAILIITLYIRRTRRARDAKQQAAALGCQDVKQLPNAWPLGLDHLIQAYKSSGEGTVMKWFVEIVDKVGVPTFEQRLLGARVINTIDPKNIEAILSTQFNDFDLGVLRNGLRPLLGDGIFTQDGSKWKHSRALLRPHFSVRRADVLEEMKVKCHELVDGLEDGQIVDLQPLFYRLTLHVTMFFLHGSSCNTAATDGGDSREMRFVNAFRIAQEHVAGKNPIAWLTHPREHRRVFATVHDYVDAAIADAIAEVDRTGESKDVHEVPFVHALLRETRDRKVLRDQSLNILIAGRDTTACTLGWTFRLLAAHPRVLHKLTSEIHKALGQGTDAPGPCRDDLKKMPYLSHVLKEVLRLYPPVPVNSRITAKNTTLPRGGGESSEAPVFMRKGEPVCYCPYIMHRRKDLYGPDANEFRPERWDAHVKEYNLSNIGWAYLPFNGGPRICLGQEFALLEASYATVKLLQAFPNVTLPSGVAAQPPGEELQQVTLVLGSQDGCVVKLNR